MTGLILIVILLVAAFFAQWIAPHPPDIMNYNAVLAPPSAHYLFGTDQFGRDILSRVIWGTQISLEMGAISVLLALVLGAAVGVFSAFYGGWADIILSRAMEIVFAFPAVLLAISIMAAFGTDMLNAMIAIGIVFTPIFARVARAGTIQVMGNEYIQSAKAVGATDLRILWRHVLPNILPILIVQTSLSLGFAILVQAALSFLGLGTQPPTPAWGLMLSEGRDVMQMAPWTVIYPGLAIVVAVFSFNLLGDGLRDVLDPQQVGRR